MKRIALLLLMVACGGVDAVEGPDAPSKCTAFRSVYCARVLACTSGITMRQCEDAFASAVDCGRAAAVAPSYDRCLAELPRFDCAVFDAGANLPAACKGVIVGP